MIRTLATSLLLLVLAQASAQKDTLQISDFGRFRTVRADISDNGNIVAYVYSTPRANDTMHINNIATGKVDTIPLASRPLISDDEAWIAYRLYPTFSSQQRLRRERKPVVWKAVLKSLTGDEKQVIDNAYNMEFSKGSGWLAVQLNRPDERSQSGGRDLLMINLGSGKITRIGSVGSYSFNKDGTSMAYTIEAADTVGNGLILMDLTTGITTPLDTERAIYSRLTWNEEGTAVAALKGSVPDGKVWRENTIIAFYIERRGMTQFSYDPREDDSFPGEYVISENGTISFSEDLDRLFFGIRAQEDKPEERAPDDPAPNVDVWHWDDDRIQAQQMVHASRDRNFTFLSGVSRNSNNFIAISDSSMRHTMLTRDGKWVVGRDDREYISDWKEPRSDYYRVNASTGERKLIIEAHNRNLGLSPDSRYLLLWKEGDIWAYDIPAGTMTNITESSPVSFVNEQFDRPGEKPPYGIAGWTKDGRHLIVNGRYDLWQIPLDGREGRNITNSYGDENEIRFRYVRTDREERFIDMGSPLLLSAFGQWTKKAGFSRLERGRLTSLIYEDRHFGSPVKPENADKFMLTIESPSEFPDFHITDLNFEERRQITDANPFIDQYHWYSNRLIEYTNKDGERLQGVLMVPDSYSPGDKLPMLVSFYEKLSHNLNRWSRVISRDTPMFPNYASRGYLVLLPDVHFRTRTTHSDMLESVTAAVEKVNELGYVDMDRVGLHGHSFSGQGGNYMVTRTDLFAAAVLGAGASNLVSDFNQLWKSSGTNQHRYNHFGQGRFGTNPWDDLDLYIKQSAVFHAPQMNTPLLLLHGTDDGSVEWLQAVEFYNALRFNRKNVILLSYPGEGHHLSRYENQVDFQNRMEQFFDHYLMGREAPSWMVNGVPFLQKGR